MKSPLRQAREKSGMTLQHLASLVLSDVGNLSRIERGVQIPSKDLAQRICIVFRGSINEMQLIYPERFIGGIEGATFTPIPMVAQRRATDPVPAPGHAGRQPPSPTNILDTIPAHSVVLPAIPPSTDAKE